MCVYDRSLLRGYGGSCAPPQLTIRQIKCFGSSMWPSNTQKDNVDRRKKTTMETGRSKLIQSDRMQTDPIRTSDDYRESQVTLQTMPSIVFRNNRFVLSMSRSLLCPSSCRFFRQVESNQSTSMLVDSLFHSYVCSMFLHPAHSCLCRPMPRVHPTGGTTKDEDADLFRNRVLPIKYYA